MSNFTTPVPVGTDWTLLFKFHKTTVILPSESTDSFAEIRSKLYTALKSTPNLNEINDSVLPDAAEDIELAIPRTAGNLNSGWVGIDIDGAGEEAETIKGKRVLKNSPKGLGLKDGAILAFRFGHAIQHDDWPVKIPTFDDRPDDTTSGATNGDIPGLAEALAKHS